MAQKASENASGTVLRHSHQGPTNHPAIPRPFYNNKFRNLFVRHSQGPKGRLITAILRRSVILIANTLPVRTDRQAIHQTRAPSSCTRLHTP